MTSLVADGSKCTGIPVHNLSLVNVKCFCWCFLTAGVLVAFAYLYMRPFVRRGLGSAHRYMARAVKLASAAAALEAPEAQRQLRRTVIAVLQVTVAGSSSPALNPTLQASAALSWDYVRQQTYST